MQNDIFRGAIDGPLSSARVALILYYDLPKQDYLYHSTYSFLQSINMQPANLIIPDQFEAKEKLLHLKMHMKLKDKHGTQFGTIEEKVIEVDHVFEFRDAHDHLIAVAHKKVLHLDTNLEVKDRDHKKIGNLDHKVIKSAISIHDKFEIQDVNNGIVGSTEQIDILKQSITIKSKHGNTVGEMKKDAFNILGDHWDCKIQDHDIDRRLLVFIPAFASVMRDEKKKTEKEAKKEN